MKAQKVYKNIIFDLGAVLMCWDPVGTLAKMRARYPQLPEDFVDLVKSDAWSDLDRGILDTEGVMNALSHRFDRTQMRDFIDLSFNTFAPIPAGIEILEAVQRKGYNTYILSNLSFEVLDLHYNKHPFFKTFDGALFSCTIGVIKPDPKIYQHLLNKYDLRPEECFFIDDLAPNIEAAKAQGIDGVICSNHGTVAQQLQKLNIL